MYNEGVIGGNGYEYRALCDLCICLGESLGHEDSSYVCFPQKASSCYQLYSIAFDVQTVTWKEFYLLGCILVRYMYRPSLSPSSSSSSITCLYLPPIVPHNSA